MKPAKGDVNENLKKSASGILVISDESDKEVETRVRESKQCIIESPYSDKQKCFVDNDSNDDHGILLQNIAAKYEELQGLVNRLPLTYHNQVLEQFEEASGSANQSLTGLGDIEKRPATLEEIQEWFEKLERNLDHTWTLCKTTEQSVDVILPLLCYVSEAYLLINNPESAAAAAEYALNKLDSESGGNWKKINIQSLCLAGEANLQLFKRRRAQKQCEKAKKLLRSEQDEKPREHVEKLEDLLFRSFQAEEEEDGDVSKVIGPDGGALELDDCTVHFKSKSLLEKRLLHASLSIVANDEVPGNLIPITPNLRLYPTVALNAPATVKLVTWLASANPLLVSVFYKKHEDSCWEKLPQGQVRLLGGSRIEFEITQFCQFCAFCEPEKAATSGFLIESRLFYRSRFGRLTNCFFPKCNIHAGEVKDKMERMKYEEVCTEDPSLRVCLDDELRVELKIIQDDQSEDIPPMSKDLTLGMGFLEGTSHRSLNFLMPRNLAGLVDFVHSIRQYRDGVRVRDTDHEDSIEMELPSSQDPMPTIKVAAQNVITGGQNNFTNKQSDPTITMDCHSDESE